MGAAVLPRLAPTLQHFRLSDLAVKVADKCVTVTGGVAGTGSRTDWELMQIHVAPALAPRPRPAREMMDPAKVRLAPGESWRLQVLLPERAFAEFGTERRAWVTEAMIHEIEVGR